MNQLASPVAQTISKNVTKKWPSPPVINRSENYDHFKFKNNRSVDANNLQKLRRLAMDGKFTPHKCPILVDRYKVIKDGQHRFVICQEFGIPIYFIQDTDDSTPEETMDLNRAGKSHTVPDRLNILKESQTQLGAEVRRAIAFWEANAKVHGLSQTMIAQLLFNFQEGDAVGTALLDKTFKVNREKDTLQLLNWLKDLAKGNFKYDKAFISALLTLMRAAGDKEQVYTRLKNNEGKITAEQNVLGYKTMLLEIFNYGRHANKKLVLKKVARPQEEEALA